MRDTTFIGFLHFRHNGPDTVNVAFATPGIILINHRRRPTHDGNLTCVSCDVSRSKASRSSVVAFAITAPGRFAMLSINTARSIAPQLMRSQTHSQLLVTVGFLPLLFELLS